MTGKKSNLPASIASRLLAQAKRTGDDLPDVVGELPAQLDTSPGGDYFFFSPMSLANSSKSALLFRRYALN